MNLYYVSPCDDYGYYVFAESRNKAKAMCVGHMSVDEQYTDFRTRLLFKDVGGKAEIVDNPTDSGYSRVTRLGYCYEPDDSYWT